jgi:hypothetical protein
VERCHRGPDEAAEPDVSCVLTDTSGHAEVGVLTLQVVQNRAATGVDRDDPYLMRRLGLDGVR